MRKTNLFKNILQVILITLLSLLFSCSQNHTSINAGNGKIMRILNLDIQSGKILLEDTSVITCEKSIDNIFFISLKKDVSSLQTLDLLPNRNYKISILIKSNFARPAEVNMGIKTMDAAGKQVMWHLNGIPNKTNGWERWEWEFSTDQRAVHGHFAAQVYELPANSELKIADLAFVEMPVKQLVPYSKGEGISFRGGPGNLPMRIENAEKKGDKIEVKVTGALYTFYTKGDSVTARQLLENEREITVLHSSIPLSDLNILRLNNKECLLVNDKINIGVQCDGLIMFTPRDEFILTLRSLIGGKWNRLACGNMLIIDEWGGFAVNPDIPLGSGRLARVDVGVNIQAGRLIPGEIDFAGIVDNQKFVSSANPGWKIKWHISSGERIAFSVFPPKPFPWKQSFKTHWMLSRLDKNTTTDYKRWKQNADLVLLWDFIPRAWAMSWGKEHKVFSDKVMNEHVAAIKAEGMKPIVYMSPYYYYSRNVDEFISEVKRLKDTYKLNGVYFDGIPSQEWIVAYEEMRMTREIYPDGVIILHNTGHPYNGIPPLGDSDIKIPAVECYSDLNFGGEKVYGYGKDWAYPRYVESQYRFGNSIGAMVMWEEFGWKGFTPLQQDLMMLRYNGRSQEKSRYKTYIDQLEKLWEQKGDDPQFYEKFYLPKVMQLTKGQLPE